MIPVRIDWRPITCPDCDVCICSTLVEYRSNSHSAYTAPTSPANPTQEGYYDLEIQPGLYYDVRLTHIGPRCKSKEQHVTLYYPLDACCPDDYTLSPDKSYCFKIEDINATPPAGSVQTMVAAQANSYSTCGTYIYDSGYSFDGTGSSTKINVANPFWVNASGNCSDGDTTSGPLNRCGVWTGTPQNNQDIGFGLCLDLPESKTYYIGIASDNYGMIKLDSNLILQQDSVALGNQYSVGPAATFKIWHIYPIELSAGPHVIELIGHNDTNLASLGCEVYSATKEQLQAASSYEELGSKLIFSSKDYIGQPVQIGTGNSGYSCPDGYSLAPCTSPLKCRKVIKVSPINC